MTWAGRNIFVRMHNARDSESPGLDNSINYYTSLKMLDFYILNRFSTKQDLITRSTKVRNDSNAPLLENAIKSCSMFRRKISSEIDKRSKMSLIEGLSGKCGSLQMSGNKMIPKSQDLLLNHLRFSNSPICKTKKKFD